MPNELENAAASLLESSDAQTTESSVETTNTEDNAPVDNDSTSSQVKESPQDKQKRTSKTSSGKDDWKKNYEELRSYQSRKDNEYVSKIKQLESKLKGFAPLEQYLPLIQKAMEEKKNSEFQEKYSQNPQDAIKAMFQEILKQEVGPLKEQIATTQNERYVQDTTSYLKSTYGEQAFTVVAPVMGEILVRAKENFGEDFADQIARMPDDLFFRAFGEIAFQEVQKNMQAKQQGNQNKQQLAQVAAGVSKPNRVAKTMPDASSKDAIAQRAYDFLQGK